MNQIVDAIRKSPRLQRLLWKGKFGLEIERLRVDSEGKLALTPHPPGLGNKSEHPYITTDFSESQLEMISPPLDSIDEAHGFIKTLHNVVRGELAPGELLWPQSMPPILPPDDQIPLARLDGDARGGTAYRQYLSETYGRARQTISGGHFNLSFLPEFFEVLATETDLPIEELKERVYLKIVRFCLRRKVSSISRHRSKRMSGKTRSPAGRLSKVELSAASPLPRFRFGTIRSRSLRQCGKICT